MEPLSAERPSDCACVPFAAATELVTLWNCRTFECATTEGRKCQYCSLSSLQRFAAKVYLEASIQRSCPEHIGS